MKFSDVIGHSEAIERLRRMVDTDKVPHALLLSGPAGVSKLSLARAFAQYLHCTNRHDGDSCGQCPSCLQHQSFNHVDTHFSFPVFKKSETTTSDDYIQEWRTFLQESDVENYERWLSIIKNDNGQPKIFAAESESIIHKMSISSYASRYKVLVMWLPEKMMETCANKLLKIIEEPFPDTVFLLVSDNAKEVLPTIYSRTQRIELKKPSTDMVAQYLQRKYNLDWQDAVAVAAPADGNIAQAEASMALDSETKQFHQMFARFMRSAYTVDLKALKDWSEEVAAYKREKARRFLQYASRMVRENYIYNLHNPSLNYLTREEEAFSTRFAPFINEINVQAMIDELNKAEIDIQGNANAKIVLFDLAVKTTIWIKKKPKQ